MKQLLLGIFTLLLQFTYAQSNDIGIPEKERRIKRIMTSEPDSAKVFIKEILAHKGKLHDTIYSNVYLSYAYYYHLKNNTDSSLYYYQRALYYTNKEIYPKAYARILRNKAGTYKKRGENEVSLKILAETEDIYQQLGDETGLAIVYGEIASNYNLLLRNDEGINYLLKALALFEKNNDNKHSVNVKHSLANTYLNAGNYYFAADLYKEAIRGFKEQNSAKNYCIALLNYGDCLTHLERYEEAQKVLNDALPGLKKFDDQEIIGIVYSKMGTIQAKLNRLSVAEGYYKIALEKAIIYHSLKTIPIASEYMELLLKQQKQKEALKIVALVEKPEFLEKATIKDRMQFEAIKAKVHEKMNNNDEALLSIQNSLKLQDTLEKTGNDITTLKLQEQFQNIYQLKKGENLQSTNLTLKERLNYNKKILLPIVAALFVLMAISFIYVYTTRKRIYKLSAEKHKKEKMLREYENIKKLNELNKQNLEYKTEELSSGIIWLSSLEESISNLITLCKEKPQDLCIENIKEQLQSLTSEKNYWSVFKKRFCETYEGFQKNLGKQFPELTKNDLFFCSLLKLNLPYKDMATLMQVTPETIVKKKYRVKKKMGIETETDLENILLNTPL